MINEDVWKVYASIQNVIFPKQINNRLEIRADGSINGGTLIYLREYITLSKDFHVKVDFNSLECNFDALIALKIDNPCAGIFNETIGIGNGNEKPYANSRGWVAGKFISGQAVDAVIQETTISSGSLSIIHESSIFHVGYNDTVIKSFSIADWTPCDRVSVALYGWSNKQKLTGSGSYFDNFLLEYIGDQPLTDVQKANIIFDWLEMLFPNFLSPSPQNTHELFGIIFRYYPTTDVYLVTFEGNLYFIDNLGDVYDLGRVDDWLRIAQAG